MSQTYTWPNISVTSSNPSVGTNGVTAPASSNQVAGKNGSGNLTPLSVDASGNLNANIASSALPTGAATAANQATGNTSLATIATNTTGVATAANQATVITNLGTLDTDIKASQPRKLQDGSGNAVTSQVSGAQRALDVGINVSGTQVDPRAIRALTSSDQVTIASSALPTGAATASNQATANTSLATIATNTGNIPAKGAAVSANATPVTIASDQTVPVSAASLPLPTGASTSANQTTGNTSLATIATNTGNIPAKGQATMANSTPVTFASDQSTLPVLGKGRSVSNAPVYNDYSVTSVTSGAYVQLVASTTSATNVIEIFDSSGSALYLGVGGSGSEVVQLIIMPGGQGRVELSIPVSSRVSVKAVNTSATSGALILNFYS